eukprot:490242_1
MSKKRKLIDNAISYATEEPPFKKQKVEKEFDEERCLIFDVVPIRDIILDYLPITFQNVQFFINTAGDAYFQRRLLHLNKYDVIKIKENIQNEAGTSEYHLHHLSIFYAHFKLLFDHNSLKTLLNVPLSRLFNLDGYIELEDAPSNIISQTRSACIADDKQFLHSITIVLGCPVNNDIINHSLFDDEQRRFLHNQSINLNNIDKLRLESCGFGEESAFRFAISPSHNSRTHVAISSFVFELHPQPVITTIHVPIPRIELHEFHTQSLLHSVKQVLFCPMDTNYRALLNYRKRDKMVTKFTLHVDHSNAHHLRNIVIGCLDDIQVDIEYHKNSPYERLKNLTIMNYSHRHTKSNLFSVCPLKLEATSMDYILRFVHPGVSFDAVEAQNNLDLVFNNENVKYTECMIEDGIVRVMHNEKEYNFKIDHKEGLRVHSIAVPDYVLS